MHKSSFAEGLILTESELVASVAILGGFGLSYLTYPVLALVPIIAAMILIAKKGVIEPLKKLRPSRRKAVLAVMTIGVVLGWMTPSHAIDFSFLLSATEQTVKTCITDEIDGLNVLTNLLFGGFRSVVMLGITWQAWEANEDRKKKQDNSDHIKVIIFAAALIIIVGVFEPLIVRSCTSAT